MLTRLAYRINATLERILPEQRLFLKSDASTRFIRLRPMTQAAALAISTALVGWTFVATSIVVMDSISAGTDEDNAGQRQALFEQRLTALSNDRDLRAELAADLWRQHAQDATTADDLGALWPGHEALAEDLRVLLREPVLLPPDAPLPKELPPIKDETF